MGLSGTECTASRLAREHGRVLVVDEDSDVLQLLAVSLKFVGFDVDTAADWPQAQSRARAGRPDAVLLEHAMTDADGVTVLRRLRAAGVEAPVLFLTARDALEEKIRALDAGADDYITKPFQMEEVVARLRAVLRRTTPAGAQEAKRRAGLHSYADLVLDDDAHEVWKADDLVALSPTEFDLLRYLLINAETLLSKRVILDHLWPRRPGPGEGAVESCVSQLRRKVDRGEPRLLHTIRGRGYILRDRSGQRR
jgi:two-component system OmpR family response regulator